MKIMIFVPGNFGTKYISKIGMRDWDFILLVTVDLYFKIDHCIKMKFSVIDFFSNCKEISCPLRICSYFLKISLMQYFINWAVDLTLLRRTSLTCTYQFIDLLCKSMDRFLYDRHLRLERVTQVGSELNLTSEFSFRKVTDRIRSSWCFVSFLF